MATNEKQLDEMETLFTALADKTRLRLLNLMRRDEVCVCFFTEVLNESQPKISRHLAYLRRAGLVSARREGKWVHYEINRPENPDAHALLENTLNWMETQAELAKEHEKLVSVCCSLDVPVTIAKAPKPEALVESIQEPTIEPRNEIETYLL